MSDNPSTFIALLRAINVGKRQLPMTVLSELCTAAGAEDVKTYIQSGNVVFRAKPAVAARFSDTLAEAIEQRCDFKVPVVVFSSKELEKAVRDNPYLLAGADPATLHLVFLADEPGPERIAALDPDRSPPHTFEVRGRVIYLHCPTGFADTKLTNVYFDKQLQTTSTVRNWRTVLKLLEMTGS